ncbi:hypothetical protein CsatB_007770 [Cannabis sativa]
MSAGPQYCECCPPRVAQMITSWTSRNPGRRFIRCPCHDEVEGHGFWMWYDPPICQRLKDVIPGLLRRIRNLEREVSMLSSEGVDNVVTNQEHSETVEKSMTCKDRNEVVESFDDNTPTIDDESINGSHTCKCQRSGCISYLVICIAICVLLFVLKA